jgi:hypothetical protein
MLDRLPPAVGWLLAGAGLLLLVGSAAVAVSASPVGIGITAGCAGYLAVLLFLLRTHRVNRAFVITTRLLFPALVGVILLEALARQSAEAQALSGGFAGLLAGTYFFQLGILKICGITTGYNGQ